MVLLDVIFNVAPEQDSAFYITELLPWITFAFVVLSFILDKYFSFREKRKEILREWYYKALFEPNFQTVTNFFADINHLAKQTYIDFETKSRSLNPNQFLAYKSSIGEKFGDTKRTFYDECLMPIFSNYPNIYVSANTFLLEIEDQFANLYGGSYVDPNEYQIFINQLYLEKGKILLLLRKPLQ